MSSFPASSSPPDLDQTELQLQQELRLMFEVDSENYLQSYLNLCQQLTAPSWATTIQELYRLVHTIKGSAATVGADAVLPVSSALEDLLGDLRYQPFPVEDKGYLPRALFEAGELLASSIQVKDSGTAALEAVAPAVQRLQVLQEQIRQAYLADWSEQRQLQHDFADQGFDLVVLDLEMAVEDLPEQGPVPSSVINLAKRTLRQLLHIGRDLQLQSGWLQLLDHSRQLLQDQTCQRWRSDWLPYLQQLKDSARQGGYSPATPQPQSVPVLRIERGVEISSDIAPATEVASDLPIPVSLQELDRSAQRMIETLLSVQATQGAYRILENQLTQILSLAQDSVHFITSLRQLQDDFALMRSSQGSLFPTSIGLSLERYRQGYTTINRLLEVNLRLSELGLEAARSAHQTQLNLKQLDQSLGGLQQAVESHRLIPFQSLVLKLRATLRDLSTRLEKPAQLWVTGEGILIDAGAARKLEPVLLHLLRNAYDHGLESERERQALGKPSEGTLRLELQRIGNRYLLTLADDGRGIDPAQVEASAAAKGMPLQKTRTPSELLAVICQPGFSTQTRVTDISGRGVGMDVVAEVVKSLGGTLTLETQIGAGTRFHLEIPVPHLLVDCVVLKAGNQTFALPVETIDTTALLDTLSLQILPPDSGLCSYQLRLEPESEPSPTLDLVEYWQACPPRQLPEAAVAIRVRSVLASQVLWLLADELLEQTDLLVNPVPDPLSAPVGLLGVNLRADGGLIPVLDPMAMADYVQGVASGSFASPTAKTREPEQTTFPPLSTKPPDSSLILVVDDAALVRRRVQVSLNSYGYQVVTCADGQEAWTWLQQHSAPALLITDIEMPGMDGFTLINSCRQQGLQMPILVISSRLSEEWGAEAKRLGASQFLTKGFSTPELINQVQILLQRM